MHILLNNVKYLDIISYSKMTELHDIGFIFVSGIVDSAKLYSCLWRNCLFKNIILTIIYLVCVPFK